MSKEIFFFIGTEAELIKLFPIIIECKTRELTYQIIASGQNDITKSRIITEAECGQVDLELSKESEIKKSAVGLLSWWIKTYCGAVKKIKDAFPTVNYKESLMVVHGDTVSTYMGAHIGKRLRMKVCHVEAGLRSHHMFNPFPEEIDRMLTSRIARVHFAPGKTAIENLSKVKGEVVDTRQNTLLDSLRYSEKMPLKMELSSILQNEYFVFVMHRQENLANKGFVRAVLNEIEQVAKAKKCVIILHEITKNAFINFELMEALKKNENIVMLPRVDYFDFMKLLNGAEFVITDGGSNQEELYYMGKPTLIMRKTTERSEGIGINAKLFGGDVKEIGRFAKEYTKMKVDNREEVSPSKIIADRLQSW